MNGGILSYDYTSHVLDAYDAYVQTGHIPAGRMVLGVGLENWLMLCVGIHQTRSTMDNHLYQTQRVAITHAYRSKK